MVATWNRTVLQTANKITRDIKGCMYMFEIFYGDCGGPSQIPVPGAAWWFIFIPYVEICFPAAFPKLKQE